MLLIVFFDVVRGTGECAKHVRSKKRWTHCIQRPFEPWVLRERPDRSVKLQVRFRSLKEIPISAGVPHLLKQPLQLAEVLRLYSLVCQRGGQRLQLDPNLIDVRHIVGRESRYECPATFGLSNQALLLQLLKGLAKRPLRHSQLVRERTLPEPGSWPEFCSKQCIEESLEYLIG